MEHSPKNHMSSSEPVLDLQTETTEALPAHSDPEEPKQSHELKQDPDSPSAGDNLAASIASSCVEPSPAPDPGDTVPSTDPQSEVKDPSPTNSLPWPEAPEESPARPNTLDFSKSLKKLEEVKQMGQRRNSDHVKENGVEVSPAPVSEERRRMESELGKCIEDFRKIKIPLVFPNKKRQWQSELLKKYQL